MGQCLAFDTQVRQIVLSNSEPILGFAPCHDATFAENERIAKIAADHTANSQQKNKARISSETATQSHRRHGITSGFCGQANSSDIPHMTGHPAKRPNTD